MNTQFRRIDGHGVWRAGRSALVRRWPFAVAIAAAFNAALWFHAVRQQPHVRSEAIVSPGLQDVNLADGLVHIIDSEELAVLLRRAADALDSNEETQITFSAQLIQPNAYVHRFSYAPVQLEVVSNTPSGARNAMETILQGTRDSMMRDIEPIRLGFEKEAQESRSELGQAKTELREYVRANRENVAFWSQVAATGRRPASIPASDADLWMKVAHRTVAEDQVIHAALESRVAYCSSMLKTAEAKRATAEPFIVLRQPTVDIISPIVRRPMFLIAFAVASFVSMAFLTMMLGLSGKQRRRATE